MKEAIEDFSPKILKALIETYDLEETAAQMVLLRPQDFMRHDLLMQLKNEDMAEHILDVLGHSQIQSDCVTVIGEMKEVLGEDYSHIWSACKFGDNSPIYNLRTILSNFRRIVFLGEKAEDKLMLGWLPQDWEVTE